MQKGQQILRLILFKFMPLHSLKCYFDMVEVPSSNLGGPTNSATKRVT